MASSLRTYATVNARLRTRISKMLSAEFMQQLEATRSLPECVQMLRGTAFAGIEPAYRETGDIRMAELALYREEIELYRDIEAMAIEPLRGFVQALSARFEIDTVKNALRLWFDAHVRQHAISGAAGYLYREPLHYKLNLDAVVNADTLQDAAAALGASPYGAIVETAMEAVTERGSLFPVEVALDRYYYDQLNTAIGRLGRRDRRIAHRLVGIDIDWQNVLWFMRVDRFYGDDPDAFLAELAPGGMYLTLAQLRDVTSAETAEQLLRDVVRRHYPALAERMDAPRAQGLYPRLAALETTLTEIRRVEAQRALCGYPFSVGMILAYFVLKEEEIQRLVTTLNAKAYGAPEHARDGKS